jgi:hypothetical protein
VEINKNVDGANEKKYQPSVGMQFFFVIHKRRSRSLKLCCPFLMGTIGPLCLPYSVRVCDGKEFHEGSDGIREKVREGSRMHDKASNLGLRPCAGERGCLSARHIRRKGERPMATEIQWEKDFDKALARAKTENKPVLMDFFNPG